MKFGTLAVLAVLLEAVSAAQVFKQFSEPDQGAWLAAQQHLTDTYSQMQRQYQHPYEHPIHMTEEDKVSAWQFSKGAENGPFYAAGSSKARHYVYVLTKVPGTSDLGRSWQLDATQPTKDAFLFWKVKIKNQKPELLAADIWAA
ncbi:hypothetical protein, partial [Sporisorium scitamineum]